MTAVALAPSLLLAQTTTTLPETAFGQTSPGDDPVKFLPEIFLDGTHSGPSFTPDGAEVFWSRYYTPEGRCARTQHIFRSSFADGKWSSPEVVSFSGTYSDGGPFLANSGTRLFFYSNRPATPGGEPSDEYISDVWYVDRNSGGWGEPQRLPFNTNQHEGMASVADDGTIYFISNRSGTRGVFDVYSSELVEDSFGSPKNLGRAVNCPGINFSPLIALDQNYIIVAHNNNAPNNGLHISFRKSDGTWTKAVGMGARINAASTQRFARLSPDGKYMFFVRGGRDGGMFWMDAGIIDNLRRTVLGE